MGIIKKIKKQKEEIYQIFGIPVCTITKSYNYRKNIFELEYSKESEDKIIEWIKDTVNMRAKIK